MIKNGLVMDANSLFSGDTQNFGGCFIDSGNSPILSDCNNTGGYIFQDGLDIISSTIQFLVAGLQTSVDRMQIIRHFIERINSLRNFGLIGLTVWRFIWLVY